jgi:peptidylprolyl isomerase
MLWKGNSSEISNLFLLTTGWDEGVMGMQLGEIARLKCSPDYAYGASGFPAWGIHPNSVLVFEVEVISIA